MNLPATFLRRSAALACAAAVLSGPLALRAADDAASSPDAFPDFESYIKISGVAPFITGDHAAFDQRAGVPTAGAGGIEDLFYTQDLSDTRTVTFDGKALAGTDDYLADFKLDDSSLGSVDIGYKRFRTFYDGVGGFFPLADEFQKASPESLHVDRGAFWATVKLAKQDSPIVATLDFRDETRTGMKDSTEWAPIINPDATVVNGALVGTAVPTNTPYIGPNVQMLDEHHDILTGTVVGTFGKTTETVRASIDTVNNDDQRDYVKFPNSAVIADPTVTVLDDEETRRSTSFQVVSQTETELNRWLAADIGLTYRQLFSANGGNWLTPTYSSTANAVYVADTASDLYGGSQFYDYVANAFLKLTPNRDWLGELGFREESNVTSSSGGFATTALSSTATTTAATNVTTSDEATYSHYLDHIATPEVSLQYLGISRVCLYGSFDDAIDRGSQHWVNPYAAIATSGTGLVTLSGAPIGSVYQQEADEDARNAKLGANWNACSFFTLRVEVYRKDHINRFIGANDLVGTASYGGLYVTGYTFTGGSVSAILRPVPELSFNTRYQPQRGMMSVMGNSVTGGNGTDVTSGKAEGQAISETVDWTPNPVFYVQGTVSVVYNEIQTAYPVVVVSSTTYIPTPVQNANNNYVTGSALCGFVLDRLTNAELQGYWSEADNYNPQISAGGIPYGASFHEETVTAGLKHKFNSRLYGEGKVGYYRRTDPTDGSFTNYRGPLLYAALTYSL